MENSSAYQVNLVPRVGAKIRITETHPSGAVSTFTGRVTEARLNGDAERVVNLKNGTLVLSLDDLGDRWTIEVEELVPPCPPEPMALGLYHSSTGDVWRHVDGGWCLLMSATWDEPLKPVAPRSRRWSVTRPYVDIAQYGPFVQLVKAPLLAELVDALGHAYRRGLLCDSGCGGTDDHSATCDGRTDLLARVQAGGAA